MFWKKSRPLGLGILVILEILAVLEKLKFLEILFLKILEIFGLFGHFGILGCDFQEGLIVTHPMTDHALRLTCNGKVGQYSCPYLDEYQYTYIEVLILLRRLLPIQILTLIMC